MVASPSTQREDATTAQVTNIYINWTISKDGVGFVIGPICYVKQTKRIKVCSRWIIYITLYWCSHTHLKNFFFFYIFCFFFQQLYDVFSCPVHSVGISVQCGVGGGSVWLCWEFTQRPVLSTGRLYPDQPAYWCWVELRPAEWQRGHFPQGFCWELHRYEVLTTVMMKWLLAYVFAIFKLNIGVSIKTHI